MTKNCFQDKLSLNAGQKYYRMLQREHSAILLTFIKLPLSLRSLFCLFLSGNFTQVLLYLHLLPIAGLFTSLMGMEFEKLKKKNSDRPTNTCKTGLGKGKQKYFLRLA